MVGMLAWKTSQGEKRGKTVTLRERELLHIRICCAVCIVVRVCLSFSDYLRQ